MSTRSVVIGARWIDPRQARAFVRNWLRLGYRLAKLCARLHVRPGAVTAIGLAAAVLTPVFATRGGVWAILAAALVLLTAAADTVDGALAVITSHTTRLGYVYDAIVDRIGEACWLLALWLIGVPAYAVVAAGALSWLHEYARSRANAAGMAEIGAATVGERPTRVVLAAFGIGMAGLVGATSDALPAGIATFAVAVWIVLSIIGFAQLFATVHSMLAGRDWPARPRKSDSGLPPYRPNNLGLDPRHVAATSAAAREASRSHEPSRSREPSKSHEPSASGAPLKSRVPASSPGPATATGPLASPAPASPGPAASGAQISAPPEAPRSPGAGPSEPPQVIDEELLREISELDDLPGASVIYTSASAEVEHHGRHERIDADDGQPEGERQES